MSLVRKSKKPSKNVQIMPNFLSTDTVIVTLNTFGTLMPPSVLKKAKVPLKTVPKLDNSKIKKENVNNVEDPSVKEEFVTDVLDLPQPNVLNVRMDITSTESRNNVWDVRKDVKFVKAKTSVWSVCQDFITTITSLPMEITPSELVAPLDLVQLVTCHGTKFSTKITKIFCLKPSPTPRISSHKNS